ncbi:acyl-CoA thioester hydrolase [Arthrobacter sp. CAN_A212]|uniref:acyl-CoA thioesterase n=1 Tax=unclassified Arthrobacter TaxID=235627 RepID=UPI0018CA8A87|nr:acyl-CoA thioesterase [Arthrobacter sp. CAN_C5]MBP2218115.1 acyl-CoA thioester hydrolase [Arthrobacter sp. CAN_C5]
MRWSDMDAYGHINNVQVLRLLEEARIHAFGPPGGTGAEGESPPVAVFSSVEPGTQALVVEHRVRFVDTLDYRNVPVRIDVWVSAVKPASFTLAYRIHDPATGAVCVKAETILAFVDTNLGSLLRLTAEQKRALAPYQGSPLFA